MVNDRKGPGKVGKKGIREKEGQKGSIGGEKRKMGLTKYSEHEISRYV